MNAILIDLFGTLIHPPARAEIELYLAGRGLDNQHPASRLCCDGWPLGPIAAGGRGDLAAIRSTLQQISFRDIEEAASHLEFQFGVEIDNNLLKLADEYHDFFVRSCTWDQNGILELIENRSDSCKVVLTTNVDSITIERLLDPFHRALFDEVVASCFYGASKPDVHLFEHAAKRVGAEAQSCTMIGDSWPSDILGALEWGAHCVWINRGHDPVAELVLEAGPQKVIEVGELSSKRWTAALAPWLPLQPSEWPTNRWVDTVRSAESVEQAIRMAMATTAP